MPHHPRSRNLRSGRYSEPGRIYLVTSTVENRRPIFAEFRLGRLVVNEFRRAELQGKVTSLAWVIMPDHIHWLLELKIGSLAHLIKQVKASSSVSINRASSCKGKLWQQGFHNRAIRQEEDLIQVARYVIANPVRAGLVKRIGDYPLWDASWIGKPEAT